MQQPKNQAEIEERFRIAETEIGQEVTDKVKIPGIANLWVHPQMGVKRKTASVKVPGAKTLHQRPFEDIADTIADVIGKQRGIVGIDWLVGEDHFAVHYVDGLNQKPVLEEDNKTLCTLLTTVLRSRPNPTAFSWDFTKPYVELSYVVKGSVR